MEKIKKIHTHLFLRTRIYSLLCTGFVGTWEPERNHLTSLLNNRVAGTQTEISSGVGKWVLRNILFLLDYFLEASRLFRYKN